MVSGLFDMKILHPRENEPQTHEVFGTDDSEKLVDLDDSSDTSLNIKLMTMLNKTMSNSARFLFKTYL